MKLLELKLIAFGPFTNQVLDFSPGEEGLHVVYGPNEAGKSSALRALRQLFYGIPRKSADAFLHPFSKLRVGARIRGNDGEKLDLVRRKGNKNTLRGSDDREVIPESTLQRFLGDVEEDTFATLFGIDHDVLVEGGREVLRGDGDVGQLLFAAGAGISGLRQLLCTLEEECDRLFKPRGQNQVINRSLSDLDKTRRELKEAELPSAEWQKHRQALERALKRLAVVEEELRACGGERNRLDRIARALPLLARRRKALGDLVPLRDAPLLREDFGSERQDAFHKLNVAKERERGALTEIRKLELEMAKVTVPRDLLDRADEIEHLRGEIASCRKALSDLRGLEAQREQLEADARAILRDLRPDLSIEMVDRLRLSAGERIAIQNLGNQKQALEERCQRAAAQVDELTQRLHTDREELARLEQPRCPDTLRATVRRARKEGELEEQLENLRHEANDLKHEATLELKKLGLWEGTLEEIEELALPPEATLDRFDTLFGELDREQRSLAERVAETKKEDAEHEQRLETLRLEQSVPTEEDLADARHRRDEGWRLVRLVWEGGEEDESQAQREVSAYTGRFTPASSLAEAYGESVRRADAIADRLRHEADRVAETAQLTARRRQLAEGLSGLHKDLEAATNRREALSMEWRALWRPLRIDPLPPREMSVWARRQRDLAGRVARLRSRRVAVERLEQKAAVIRSELGSCLESLGQPDVGRDEGLEAVLNRCEAVVEHITATRARRRELEQDIKELEGALEIARADVEKTEGRHATWRSKWESALERLGLSDDATPAQVNDVLARFAELFEKLRDAEGLCKRVDSIHRDSTRLERALRELATQVAPDLAWLPFEEAAAELIDRFSRATEEQRKLSNLKEQKSREEATLRNARGSLEEVRGVLTSLSQEALCQSFEELPGAETRSVRRRDLETQLKALDEQLVPLAGSASLEQFTREAEAADGDSLRPRIAELEEKIRALEEEKRELDQTVGGEKNALETMRANSLSARATEKAERAQELLASIESQVEHYTQLRLASVVLRRGIDRYRERNQGPVLQRAGELFHSLTLGSFVALEADVDDRNQPLLQGVRPNGDGKVAVDGMSDGSRDQLYLALRLATLERYLEKNPPLPFVVDDILVNFDDARSAATLKALAQLSAKTQVIFFTHHCHLVDLARKVVPPPVLSVKELSA